jgi:hypothetical protein
MRTVKKIFTFVVFFVFTWVGLTQVTSFILLDGDPFDRLSGFGQELISPVVRDWKYYQNRELEKAVLWAHDEAKGEIVRHHDNRSLYEVPPGIYPRVDYFHDLVSIYADKTWTY